MKPHRTDKPARKTGAARAVAALFRIGTRRCRLAAAFVAVMVGLTGQTADQAFAQAKGSVLYLDAPAVSTDRATRAGETASAYSDPRSPASPDALAWLGVRGPRGDETEAPPQDASGAFASITAPDAEGTPGITAEAAYDAGATMLAQIEDGAPSEDGRPGEDNLAAAGAVRPELGDDTQAPEEQPSAGYDAPPVEQPATPDVASSAEPVPVAEPVAEPSGDEGLALESPASAPAATELAAAPTGDASPSPDIPLDARPDYGATGPISEPAAEPAPTTEPEKQEEVQEPEIQEEEIQESEGGSEELAGADATPAASPEPADEAAYDDPTYKDSAPAPDTGPTSGESDDVALAPTSPPPTSPPPTSPPPTSPPPTSPPPAEEAGGPDDLASASDAPEESGQDDASANVSQEQTSEVVIVQGFDSGEETGFTVSPFPDFAPPTDEAEGEGDGAEDAVPPSWAPPSDETEPQTASPVEQPTDESAEEENVPPSETPDEQPPGQTSPGSGETSTPPPADDAEEPAPGTPPGAGPTDGDSAPPEEAPPEEAPPAGGGQDDPQNPGSGEASAEGPAPPGGTPGGTSQAPPHATEPAPVPGGDAGTNGPRPEADDPTGGGFDQRPYHPREDHGSERRDRGHSGAVSPDERLRSVQESDGGAEAVQEKARESTRRSGSGGEQRSVTEFREERSSGGGRAPELPASIAPRGDDASALLDPAQDGPLGPVEGPAPDLERRGSGGFGVAGRSGKDPASREERGTGAGAANPEDAEAGASDGSQAENYLVRAVEPAREDAGGSGADRVDPVRAEEPAPATTSPERRDAPRAERFGARAPERKAERPAGRVLTRQAAREQVAIEQAAVERTAVPEQRRQNRPEDGGAFDAQGHAAPSTGRRWNTPDHQETVVEPTALEPAPVRQVKIRRFAPVEQPAAVRSPPAQRRPAAPLAPAPQAGAQPQARQQFGPEDAGPAADPSVVRVTRSVNRGFGD